MPTEVEMIQREEALERRFKPKTQEHGDPCPKHPWCKIRYKSQGRCVECQREAQRRYAQKCSLNPLSSTKGERQPKATPGQNLIEGIERLADGQPHKVERKKHGLAVAPLSDCYATRSVLAVIPWLKVEWRDDNTAIFNIDPELKDICDGRRLRPQLGAKSIMDSVRLLNEEITKKRKDIGDPRKYGAIYRLDERSKVEQSELLNWIQEELEKVTSES